MSDSWTEAITTFRAVALEAAQPVVIMAASMPRQSASEEIAAWCVAERSRRGLPEPTPRSEPDWSAIDAEVAAEEAERWTISRLAERAVAASGLPREVDPGPGRLK